MIWKCAKCEKTCSEEDVGRFLQRSHNIPRYMFKNRNHADKCGRRYLCKKCHDIYDRIIPSVIMEQLNDYYRFKCINAVKKFSDNYFNGNTKTTETTGD